MMHLLVVNPGTPQAWEIQLKPGTNFLGRGDGNDFTIDDPSVSGSHCQVDVSNEGVILKDLGSTNGTFLNNTPVFETALQPGQSVRLGNIEMLFDPEEVRASAPMAATATRRSVRVLVPQAAPPSEPPVEPIEDTVPPAPPVPRGSRFCKFHPRSPARWLCNKCNRSFCELCVASRPMGGRVRKMCRSCAVECVPLEVAAMRPISSRGFFGRIPGAFLYPLRGDGAILMIAGTILYLLIELAGFFARFAGLFGWGAMLILLLFGTGYFLTYMRRILTSSAMGEDAMPDWPEFSDFGELVGIFFQFLGVVLISFSPAAILAWRAIGYDETWAGAAMIPALCFGCVYLPMAFLAFSMLDSVTAANPLVVLPAIARVIKEYAIAVVLFSAVLGLRWACNALLDVLSPAQLTTHSFANLFLIFGARAISNFIGLYLFTVNMRVLGLLYLTKREKLGWFNR